MIALPLFNKDATSDLTTSGIYRLVFGKGASGILDIPYQNRKTFSPPLIAGFTVWTEKSGEDLDLYLSFEPKDATQQIAVKESKIPIPIIYGVVAIAGLAVGSLFLKRVEKIIDNPVIELSIVSAVLFGSIFLIQKLKRAKP